MQPLVRTPQELEKNISGKWEENELFIKKIQHLDSEQFNEKFNAVFFEVEKKIDCTACANCCKKFHVGLPDDEIERLASLKEMPVKEFKDSFTATEALTGITFLKLNPCIFLQGDNLCSIYSQRPQACRNYPVPQGNIKFRLRKVMDNYTVCPIVYNTIEILKEETDSLNQS